jgi:hypothetical protein
VAPGKLSDDVLNVAGEPSAIERSAKALGPTAIAHVHADHVNPRCHAHYIHRITGSLQGVYQYQCEPFPPLGLPMAVIQDLHILFYVEELFRGRRQQIWPVQKAACQRMQVRAA